jgi:hypothetical protein
MVFVLQECENGNGESQVSNGTSPPGSSIVGATLVRVCVYRCAWCRSVETTDRWCLSCREADLNGADLR